MASVTDLSDAELRKKLTEYGFVVPPVTDSTRKILQKKLQNFMSGSGGKKKTSIASFSSGEEDEGAGSGKTSMPPPSSSAGRNRRKTIGVPSAASRNDSPPPRRKNTRQSMLPSAYTPPDPSPPPVTKSVHISRKTTVTKTTRNELPAETGSDTDDDHNRSWQTTKKSTTPKKAEFDPFRALGLRSSATTSEPAPPPSPFVSQFGRSLGRMRSFPSSHNGSTSQESEPPRGSGPKPIPPPAPMEEHTWWNTHLVSKSLMAIFVVFFAYLAFSYMGIRSSSNTSITTTFESNPENKFPLCKDGQMPGVNCVVSAEARSAMAALKLLVPKLTEEAINAICYGTGEGEGDPGVLSYQQIIHFLEMSHDPDAENNVANMRILARHNPHWGVEVKEKGLAIKNPSLPFLCFLTLQLYKIMAVGFILALTAAAIYAVSLAVKSYHRSKEERRNSMYELACGISETLAAQTQERDAQGRSISRCSLQTLQDLFIKPCDRKRMQSLWNEAVEYLLSQDANIKSEVHIIAGEETPVLVWSSDRLATPKAVDIKYRMFPGGTPWQQSPTLQQKDTPTKKNVNSPPGRLMTEFDDSMDESPVRMQKVWQGQAISTGEGSVNSVPYSPTPCLKLRKMFNPDVARFKTSDEERAWVECIQNSILEKCGDTVNILHVAIDKKSTDGCVYLKCASPLDAGQAFRSLHGAWYDGNLVTVKYLRLERYHERFPDAADTCFPLHPSNNQKLSLQAHWVQTR